MGAQYRALEWLQRRKEGESVAQIAARDGVDVRTVRRATDPYGPFPRTEAERRFAARRGQWIQLRRTGVPVNEIARIYGVSRQVVTRATAAAGPFPRPGKPTDGQVRAWVEDRRAGRSIAEIASAAGVAPSRVADATRPHGPYRWQRRRAIPDEVYCLSDIARRLRVATAVVSVWEKNGHLPAPDFITARGRRLWLHTTITAWLPESGLQECPICGTFARQLKIHRGMCHPQPEPPQ